MEEWRDEEGPNERKRYITVTRGFRRGREELARRRAEERERQEAEAQRLQEERRRREEEEQRKAEEEKAQRQREEEQRLQQQVRETRGVVSYTDDAAAAHDTNYLIIAVASPAL